MPRIAYRMFWGAVVCGFVSVSALEGGQDNRVLPGLDRLRRAAGNTDAFASELVATWKGRRVGVITNHTGRSLDGTPILRVLTDELNLDVVALFSPEHGFDGASAAGVAIESRASGDSPPVYPRCVGRSQLPVEISKHRRMLDSTAL